jgi:hypothetical protein
MAAPIACWRRARGGWRRAAEGDVVQEDRVHFGPERRCRPIAPAAVTSACTVPSD